MFCGARKIGRSSSKKEQVARLAYLQISSFRGVYEHHFRKIKRMGKAAMRLSLANTRFVNDSNHTASGGVLHVCGKGMMMAMMTNMITTTG